MIRLTGLWKQKGKDGKTFLNGNMGNVRIMILPNEYQREGKKDPDYHLMISEKPPKEETATKKQKSDDDL